MTDEQAWKELREKFPHLGTHGEKLLYFWEPDESTPVSTNIRPGWSWKSVTTQEDLADAYAVVFAPYAPGTVMIYAKWPRQGWGVNPWNTRHLIRHLVDKVMEKERAKC